MRSNPTRFNPPRARVAPCPPGTPPPPVTPHSCRTPYPHGTPRSPRGFSLLEMMFVFILIGLLAGLVAVNARHYLVKGKQNAARAEISSICTAVETFYAAHGRYPSSEEGLAVLATKSDKIPDPLLKRVPNDPWGRPYQYNMPGRTDPYEVACYGADGRAGGEGADADIGSWDLKEGGAKR